MDWEKIKAEYISGKTSYRKLAEKHNVSFGILRRVAEREKWTSLRTQTRHKTDTQMIDAVSDLLVAQSLEINEVADKLLKKISKALDETDILASQSIKHFTSALKDIKDIKGIKDERQSTSISISFEGDVEKYGN